MLGQRLSNEQSNVGPTKYVAVGPTLNQRLGFGWRMVSVLAGNINEDGSTHVIVYGKLTHTDQYLNISLQHKMSVLRTLMRRAEVMVTRLDCRTKEMAHIQDSLKTNGYKQWMFKVSKPNQQQSITSTRPTINVGLSCMQGTSEALTCMVKAHGVSTFNRHIN